MPRTPDAGTHPGADAPAALELILGERPPPFAVLHRPHVTGPDAVEILLGDVVTVPLLADLPLPGGPPEGPSVPTGPDGAREDLLAVVPFRQIRERGFDCVDDGTPLLALRVTRRDVVPVGDLLAAVPDGPATFVETGYDVPDAEYEAQVRAVLAEEIAAGAGSNFVIHRALTGRLAEPPARAALGVLRRLLLGERRAYWTFAVHTDGVTLVGATPERHVSLAGGLVRMNPISGTLRHPPGGYASRDEHLAAVEAFLADPKERDELVMVVDEELKMMAAVCGRGGRVEGPYLKEMAHLAHTEYVLTGRTSMDVRRVLTATMFAPTVTGSPLRNACRVIARHERRGRGYYGGVLALVGRDEEGRRTLDAPILIRTAEIAPDGTVLVRAGATLVRGSRPDAELAETRAKAAGVMAALQGPAAGDPAVPTPFVPAAPGAARPVGSVAADARVSARLGARNATLAPFWLREQPRAAEVTAATAGAAQVTVVDAEDDFTAMLAHVLHSLGRSVRLVQAVDAAAVARLTGPGAGSPGLVVLGPGPGDPREGSDPRLAALRAVARARLAAGAPVLAVCLGHQALAAELGLPLRRLPRPNQGVQERIDLFGTPRDVGFYNSFVAHVPPGPRPGLDFSADAATGRVHAFRGPAFTGLQFHAESVLTTDGIDILRAELHRLASPAGLTSWPA